MWVATTILGSVAATSHVRLHRGEQIKISNSSPNCALSSACFSEFRQEPYYLDLDLLTSQTTA